MQAFEKIAKVLENANLFQSAQEIRQQLKKGNLELPENKEIEIASLLNKAMKDQDQSSMQEEKNQEIMEKFMTRLVTSPNLLNDERINSKIEKIFHVEVFQKMVQRTETLNISVTSEREHQTTGDTSKGEDSEDSFELPQFESFSQNQEGSTPSPREEQVRTPSINELMVEDELMQAQSQETSQSIQSSSKVKEKKQQEPASFVESHSLMGDLELDEYEDDDDPGFVAYTVTEENFIKVSMELAEKNDFPARACGPKRPSDPRVAVVPDPDISKEMSTQEILEKKQKQQKKAQNLEESSELVITQPKTTLLPSHIKHPESNDDYYPVEFEGVVYDCMNLKVVYDREKTGFEETKDIQIVVNSVIAGRYQVMEYLGSAAFSKAIQALDLLTNIPVCMKIIENNKDYVDQSIDEIKLLKYINLNGDPDEHNVLKVIDYFYYKEHLIIVTELLRDNLYEFYRYNRENEEELYFTVGRLQKVTYQVLKGLEFIHSLHLIHCDLKPENILIKSYSRCEVKVIDFGSSCYIHDHLSSYVQSRSYRAPEVILGCRYNYKIDIWSLGCILAELFSGYVLFQNDSIQGLLARVIGIIGPIPEDMFTNGRLIHNYFTKEKLLYQEVTDDISTDHLSEEMAEIVKQKQKSKRKIQILVPKKTTLRARIRTEDAQFLDFIRWCLEIDKDRRPSATEALQHPWITKCTYPDGLQRN